MVCTGPQYLDPVARNNHPSPTPLALHHCTTSSPVFAGPLSLSAILQVFHWRRNARISQSRATASMIIESWLSSAFRSGRSAAQAPLSRKRKSISRTVSGLTGKIQSPGVEKQPGVEHLICKARSPLVPPTTSIRRPEITFLQMMQ